MNGEYTSQSVEVLLSRPEYRLGSTVVGSIRLDGPRDCYESAQVYVVGRCRIDARWHNPDRYKRSHSMVGDERDGEEVVCFTTNVVDLMELKERQVGKWRDVKPKPLRLPPDNPELYFTEDFNDPPSNHDTITDRDFLERRQVLFTFRAELPTDIPATASLTCCRYSYAVVVHVITSTGKEIRKHIPFHVSTTLHPTHEQVLKICPVIGTCRAMAHSSGLPCHVSYDDMNAPRGQTCWNGGGLKMRDVQTLRVADPSSRTCCILTAIGSSIMVPGGQVLIQFDFDPQVNGDDDDSNNNNNWTPCFAVCACLEGTEFALPRKNRVRAHLFDTAHEYIEPDHVRSIALTLRLPLDCPVTMHTDLVQVETKCRIDISVGNSRKKFTNLRLDLPVTVVHGATAEEADVDYDQEEDVEPLCMDNANGDVNPERFQTRDIRKDLKILSLLWVDKCQLLLEEV